MSWDKFNSLVKVIQMLSRLELCEYFVHDTSGHSSPGLVVTERKK